MAFETLLDRCQEKMGAEMFRAESPSSPAIEVMMKILNFFIKNSGSNSRSKVWSNLFNQFGFRKALQFARWGSNVSNPIIVKGAAEVAAVFDGLEDPEVLTASGIDPVELFSGIEWKGE
tara:strand:+ start:10441 stop:10797 length:357 start_codon:yes stop_codon:yes gene_type:complete